MWVVAAMFLALTMSVDTEPSTITVSFKLGNGTVSPNHVFNLGDTDSTSTEEFGGLDGNKTVMDLFMISDENMLGEFKRFLYEDGLEDMGDIDVDLFTRFILASDSLCLRGEALQRFSRNMARKGLLGRHSLDIFRTQLDVRCRDIWLKNVWLRDICLGIFVEFAAQTGNEVRVSGCGEATLCAAGDPEAGMYGALACNFSIDGSEAEKMGGIKKLTIWSMRRTGDVGCMTILAWILHHLEIRSLVIRCGLELTPEEIYYFAGAGSWIGNLEGLNFVEQQIPGFESIKTLISHLPSLKELSIRVGELSAEDASAFEGYEKLNLYSGYDGQSPSFIRALRPHLPSLKELSIEVKEFGVLSAECASAFEGYEKLEKLDLYGVSRRSPSFIRALRPHLPSLKGLSIRVGEFGVLSAECASAFEGYEKLEKLDLYGFSRQSPSFIRALRPHLPSLKGLSIWVGELSAEDASAFEGYEKLEKLDFSLSEQIPPSFVRALRPYLPSLKELSIGVKKQLSAEDASAFEGYEKLEKLNLYSGYDDVQSPSFVRALRPYLPSLKELSIGVKKQLSAEDAKIFEGYEKLEKLDLPFCTHNPSFVRALRPYLPSLKELSIGVKKQQLLSTEDAKIFEGYEKHGS
jgi:hypothetical protein